MKISTTQHVKRGVAFMALAFSSLVIASCAMSPQSPDGAAQARSDLTALRSDPKLSDQAPAAIREAEEAVRIAEQPLDEDDAELGKHRVYIADRKVSIAVAKATTGYAEEQRALLAEERDEARLQARTREVREARSEAEMARSEAERARRAADAAQSSEAQRAAEYQRQIDALEAEVTDRGVVVTLGDVLFATGSAELQSGDSSNLNKLVIFLNQYPKRQVKIEGHTDNVGSATYNQGLSQRRAESVKNYLVQQGIASHRISTAGLGMGQPVANNDTATGRQQNRRVEIIIDNPPQT